MWTGFYVSISRQSMKSAQFTGALEIRNPADSVKSVLHTFFKRFPDMQFGLFFAYKLVYDKKVQQKQECG